MTEAVKESFVRRNSVDNKHLNNERVGIGWELWETIMLLGCVCVCVCVCRADAAVGGAYLNAPTLDDD